MSEEHPDLALYYRLPQLCKGLKLIPVPLKQFRGTLASLGYRVSHFHREPEAVKTDAPNEVVYDLMRLWAEEHPPKTTLLPEILKKELTLKRPVEWKTEDEAPKKVPKFLPNPEPCWGPKPRARGGPTAAAAAAPAASGSTEEQKPGEAPAPVSGSGPAAGGGGAAAFAEVAASSADAAASSSGAEAAAEAAAPDTEAQGPATAYGAEDRPSGGGG